MSSQSREEAVSRPRAVPQKRARGIHFSRRVRGNPIAAILGVIWLIIAFYPVLYMLFTSLRSQNGYLSAGSPWLPPSHPTLASFRDVLHNSFWHYFLNSVIVTVSTVVLIAVCGLLAAYVIARIKSKVAIGAFNVLLVGLAVPLQATIIPIYALMIDLHLYDSLIALILPSVAFGIPLAVLILVNFIRDIPRELYESMALDGSTHGRVLINLVVPLARPALITVIVYNTVFVWNGFLFPLILTQSQNVRVLPLALWSYQGQFGINVPALLAAVLLSAVPIILLYIIGRRQLLSGLLVGFSK